MHCCVFWQVRCPRLALRGPGKESVENYRRLHPGDDVQEWISKRTVELTTELVHGLADEVLRVVSASERDLDPNHHQISTTSSSAWHNGKVYNPPARPSTLCLLHSPHNLLHNCGCTFALVHACTCTLHYSMRRNTHVTF